MRVALLLLGFVLAVPAASAQPVFDWLTRADGMPSDYVLAVYPDRWGFVWFGTDAGAVRYDGRRLRTFSVDDGLPHAYVQGFAETGDGTLWAATNAGLARWTGSRWEPVDSPLGRRPVGRLWVDARGRLVASNAVAMVRREGERWRVGQPAEGLGHKSASFVELSGGRLLVGGYREPFVTISVPEGEGFRSERWPVAGLDAIPDGAFLSVLQIDGRLVGLLAERGLRVVPLRLDEAGRRLVAGADVPIPTVRSVVRYGDGMMGYGDAWLRTIDLATGAVVGWLARPRKRGSVHVRW